MQNWKIALNICEWSRVSIPCAPKNKIITSWEIGANYV